jgi:hypothetical protein
MAGWRRIVETATELPEISANVANLATDEIDYLRLVFCDRYGLDVLTIPQARSISEMFGDCASEPDFHRRVAALADLLGHLAPCDALPDAERVDENGVRVGPPVALQRLIQRDYPEALGHVQTLRLIPKARIMFPTHSRTREAIGVMRGLPGDGLAGRMARSAHRLLGERRGCARCDPGRDASEQSSR